LYSEKRTAAKRHSEPEIHSRHSRAWLRLVREKHSSHLQVELQIPNAVRGICTVGVTDKGALLLPLHNPMANRFQGEAHLQPQCPEPKVHLQMHTFVVIRIWSIGPIRKGRAGCDIQASPSDFCTTIPHSLLGYQPNRRGCTYDRALEGFCGAISCDSGGRLSMASWLTVN
jgi:hypothetical protein